MCQPPSFVPGEYCLSCRGCCVFARTGGDWSPRLTSGDVSRLEAAAPGTSWRDGRKRIRLESCAGGRACFFLDRNTHHCRVYPDRPLECRLYPVLVSSEADGIHVSAHEACPYVREHKDTPLWRGYVARVRAFFSDPQTRRMLAKERGVFADYSAALTEMIPLMAARTTFPDELLGQRGLFEQYAGTMLSDAAMLSSRCFANMFIWQDHFDFHLTEHNGSLLVEACQPAGTFLYLPPLGSGPTPVSLGALFDRLRRQNRGGGAGRIENVSSVDLDGRDVSGYQVDLRGHEYVYRRKDVAALAGGAFKSQRHAINTASRELSPRIRPYRSADREGCRLLLERWLDKKSRKIQDCMALLMLEDMRQSHALLWDYAGALGLEGRVAVLEGGRIGAYTFGAKLNARVFCVLAEIGDPDKTGLSSCIFHRFADDPAVKSYEFLNVMDDAGLPALKASKWSWRPAVVAPVYAISAKGLYV